MTAISTALQAAPALNPFVVASVDDLQESARRAIDAGQLESAVGLLEVALSVARQDGDEERADLAFCNLASVLITLGRHEEVVPGLREILVRNRSVDNCVRASYYLSRAYVRRKEPKKGLFYARIAKDRAQAIGRRDWLVTAHMQIANCLVDESFFDRAAAEYEIALGLLSDEASLLRAGLECNYGYCQMMLGDLRRGFELSFRSLRCFRRLGASSYEVWQHLDLCYAYLEIERFDRARSHGLEALRLAEAMKDPDRIKNALFMLGETERSAGDLDLAWDYFSSLQQRFYPENPAYAELMVAVSMRPLVNLRA